MFPGIAKCHFYSWQHFIPWQMSTLILSCLLTMTYIFGSCRHLPLSNYLPIYKYSPAPIYTPFHEFLGFLWQRSRYFFVFKINIQYTYTYPQWKNSYKKKKKKKKKYYYYLCFFKSLYQKNAKNCRTAPRMHHSNSCRLAWYFPPKNVYFCQ